MRLHASLAPLLAAALALAGAAPREDGPIRCRLARYLANHPEGLAPAREGSGIRGIVTCEGGTAGGFPCSEVDLLAHLTLAQLGGAGNGNDIWGWTDPLTGVEYALVGLSNGTAFVDLSDPANPVYLGKLPPATGNSLWRDLEVSGDYVFIVSEASSHGMQIFDLTELRDVVNPPVTFTATDRYTGFGSAHTVNINPDTGFAYANGTGTCSGGLHMVDINDPLSATFAGCYSGDGYTHDVQCVVYHGPDLAHFGDEICFASNEDTVTVVDVTDKSAPVMLDRQTYPAVGYTHQGWLTEDHRHFLLDDEFDETNPGEPDTTRTHVFDVDDLENIFEVGFTDGPLPAIDHNQYVRGDHVFQSNYTAGLRILHLDDLATGTLSEVAFFDTFPAHDAQDFDGTWSNYPFYESGVVVVNDISGGLFVVRPRLPIFDDGFESGDTSAWNQTVP